MATRKKVGVGLRFVVEVTLPDYWTDPTWGESYGSGVSINGGAPDMVTFYRPGREWSRARVDRFWLYVNSHLEEAINQASLDLLTEGMLASIPDEALSATEKLAGADEIAEVHTGEIRSHTHGMVVRFAARICERVRGGGGFTSSAQSIRLSPLHLKKIFVSIQLRLPQLIEFCKEVRANLKAHDDDWWQRALDVAPLFPEDLLDALKEKRKDRRFRYTVKEVAYAALAREAGAISAQPSQARTIERQIKNAVK